MKKFVFGLLGMLMVVGVLSVKAQTNPYKIDDRLYPLYLHAFKYRTSSRCIALSDSLFHEANRLGDKKAACLAKVVPMSYYMNTSDSLALLRAVRELQAVSKRNGYLQYYYHGYNSYIIWLLRRGHLLQALDLTKTMRREAEADNSAFGFYSCIRRQGDIYTMRGDARRAVAYYREALRFQLKYLPEQDPAAFYDNIAKYYRETGHPDSLQLAYNYALEGVRRAKSYETRTASRMELCLVLFQMRRTDEFICLYDSLKEEMDKMGRVQMNRIILLRACRAAVEHRWDDAVKWACQQGSKGNVYSLLRNIFMYKGDYEKAFRYDQIYNKYCDSIARQAQSVDVAEMAVLLADERMKMEAQDLEMEHAMLMLKNTRLELEQVRLQATIEKTHAENSRLTLENSNLDLKRLNSGLERQKVVRREAQMMSNTRIALLVLGLGFFAVFIGLLLFHGYRHRVLVLALKAINRDLIVERDKAEQSDKMKTEFMQNVSHEIRTPLNAIVGFSQLLTAPGIQACDQDKGEFCETIQRNSDLLASLINDMLDLASLESGKNVMHIASCKCNDVCRAALASVQHRKPSGVNLYFTSEADDDYQLVTDGIRIQQVLINFLTNAEKNTSEGEIHLHCSLSEVSGRVTFSVADTGPGVPADKVDCIFERFIKLDAFKQGTGLGLNICRVIAERLQGEVKYDLNYTRGARFLLILPLGESAA